MELNKKKTLYECKWNYYENLIIKFNKKQEFN